MGQKIDLVFNDAKARGLRQKIRAAFSGGAQDATVRKAAEIWRGRMIRRTPKRWTGQLRRSWQVQRLAPGVHELTNTSKVMLFLEKGTKAHGPKTAKRLFIPLTRKAAMAGPRGVIYALKQWSLNKTFGASNAKKKPPFVMFVDYVWAKRVRGIKARWIVRSARPQAANTLRILMREYITRALRS
jgi:hypothetical protein